MFVCFVSEHRYKKETRSNPESERTIELYDTARYDGLSKIELMSISMVEYYIGRDDK